MSVNGTYTNKGFAGDVDDKKLVCTVSAKKKTGNCIIQISLNHFSINKVAIHDKIVETFEKSEKHVHEHASTGDYDPYKHRKVEHPLT